MILISLCRVNGAALEDKSVCLAFIVRYSTRPIIAVWAYIHYGAIANAAGIRKAVWSGANFGRTTCVFRNSDDNTYDKAVKILSALKGKTEKILVAPKGLMLEKDKDDRYIFAPGSNFAQLLTAKIFEFDFITDSGMDLIGFNDSKYLFPNRRDMLRSAFDNDYN